MSDETYDNNESVENNGKNGKKQKSLLQIIFTASTISFITGFFMFTGLPNSVFGPTNPKIFSKEKSCFSNCRVIQGAVEMYNMDNVETIKEFDGYAMHVLVEQRYLKKEPEPPLVTKCKYLSKGDLSKENDGTIYCEYHGSPDRSVAGNVSQDDLEYEKSEARKADTKKMLLFGLILFGPALLYILLAVI